MPDIHAKRFFPVIHCICPYEQQGVGHAISNTKIAMENGADGVFLIGHGLLFGDLVYIYDNVRKQFPDIWIGVNFLDLTGYDNSRLLCSVVRKLERLHGLWMDVIPDVRLDIPSTIEVFGGVAFKYRDSEILGEELKVSCKIALDVVDVITTSGTKTGQSPDPRKLEAIRENIGNDIRIALASGVTGENVKLFPQVNDFIVASSIIERSDDHGGHEYFVPVKVARVAQSVLIAMMTR